MSSPEEASEMVIRLDAVVASVRAHALVPDSTMVCTRTGAG